MAEEKEPIKGQEEQQPTQDDFQLLLNKYKELEKNTVPKSKFDEAQAHNRQLLESMTELKPHKEPEPPKDYAKMKKELTDPDSNLTNLGVMTRVIELREHAIAEGKKDPFLPTGQNVTEADRNIAERVAEGTKALIEEADGDDAYFATLMSNMLYGRR